jgi:hypothetical protein
LPWRALTLSILAAAVAPWEDRSPATLERFLRARDYDVGVAAALFLEHRAWRQQLGVRVPGDRVPARQFGEQKIALQGLSRAGRPLLIIVAKRHDKCVAACAQDGACACAHCARYGRATGSTATWRTSATSSSTLWTRRAHASACKTQARASVVPCGRARHGSRATPHTRQIMDAMRPGEQFVVLVDFAGLSRSNADLKARGVAPSFLRHFCVFFASRADVAIGTGAAGVL